MNVRTAAGKSRIRPLARGIVAACGFVTVVFAGAVMSVGGSVTPAPMIEPPTKPIVIGHRGASGDRPEHTLEAYWLAIQEGADVIEPDLVVTSDGHLVARHENEISTTTDVATRPEFSSRMVTKSIDGVAVTGWFTEDFTLAELKTLRARERLPVLRATTFDGRFTIPTLQEVIDLVKSVNVARAKGRSQPAVGIYPETKHPTYFDSIGLSMEERLVAILHANGYLDRRDPVFIQSFEVANLKDLASLTNLKLVQLLNAGGRPWDFTVSGDPRTYADMATRDGLREIATYAQGVGANKNLIIPRGAQNQLLAPTTLIQDAHRAGLIVHAWTFRGENTFLPVEYRRGTDDGRIGDMLGEAIRFLELGLDGFFTDHPGIGSAAVAAFRRW
jgi:glycerophosphoryl diester phosphodiesterase